MKRDKRAVSSFLGSVSGQGRWGVEVGVVQSPPERGASERQDREFTWCVHWPFGGIFPPRAAMCSEVGFQV